MDACNLSARDDRQSPELGPREMHVWGRPLKQRYRALKHHFGRRKQLVNTLNQKWGGLLQMNVCGVSIATSLVNKACQSAISFQPHAVCSFTPNKSKMHPELL